MTYTPPSPEQQDRNYTVLATFLNIIVLIPALIFYFGFRDRGPLISAQSKENLNWTIGMAILAIGAPIVSAIIGWIPILGWLIAFLLAIVTWLAWIINIVFSIIGGVRLAGGASFYKYPFTIQFVR